MLPELDSGASDINILMQDISFHKNVNFQCSKCRLIFFSAEEGAGKLWAGFLRRNRRFKI